VVSFAGLWRYHRQCLDVDVSPHQQWTSAPC
jgi:hypothetical protein